MEVFYFNNWRYCPNMVFVTFCVNTKSNQKSHEPTNAPALQAYTPSLFVRACALSIAGFIK
jgi:hypothetical protein